MKSLVKGEAAAFNNGEEKVITKRKSRKEIPRYTGLTFLLRLDAK